jgi:hypothetical protein
MKVRILFFFTALLLVSSCKDDVPQVLNLHTPQEVDNTIILNWEQATVSGFEYYMVMRASDGQHYEVINDISTPTSNAFRKEITVFEDRTYPIADSLYYKIMAVGDEIVSSRDICYKIENPARLLNGNFIDLYYVEETGKISAISYENGYGYKLKVFDLETGQFSSNEATIDLSSSGCWYFWGKYNGKTEFYNYDSDWTLYVYDASTVQQLATLNTPSSVWYEPFTSNNKGTIYIFDYYLYLINRATGTYTTYQPENYCYADDLYYDSKENKLYAVDYGRILTFSLNEAGEVIEEEIYQLENISSTPLYIENSSSFVVATYSGIKIFDMNTKTFHNTELTQIPRLILLKNNILYASDNYSRNIYQLSADNFTLIKSTPVRVTPVKMVAGNEYLYIIGQYDYERYLLEKIKL